MSQFLPLNGNVTPIWTNEVHNVLANLISKKYGIIPKTVDDLALVTSLNGIQGPTTIAAGTNITIGVVGSTLTINSTGGGGGTPGGSTTEIQYNNAGAFAGSAGFIWNNTTKQVTVSGNGGLNLNAGLALDSALSTSTSGTSYIDFKLNGTLLGNIAVNKATANNPLEINSATNKNVMIVAGGGNVGFGVPVGTSPVSKVEVRGALTVDGKTSTSSLAFFQSETSYTEIQIKNAVNNPVGFSFYGANANPASDFVHEFGSVPRLVIGRWMNYSFDSGGAISIFGNRNVNIGTGTGDPGFKLRVQGTLRVQGKVSLEGSTTSSATMQFPSGATVTSPIVGDMWREGDSFKYFNGTNTYTFWHTGNLATFTTSVQGLVPASGGGSSNFLRADGTWAAPPGSAVWGGITGTLSSQTDLQTALNGKQNSLGYTPANKAGDTFTGNTAVQGTMSAYYHASTNGTIGSQYVNFGMFSSGGVVQWQWGWDADRSFSIWSYNDTGTYITRPLNIARDGTAIYFTGRMFGNGGGNGIGALTLTTTSGTPSGGSSGDIKLVY